MSDPPTPKPQPCPSCDTFAMCVADFGRLLVCGKCGHVLSPINPHRSLTIPEDDRAHLFKQARVVYIILLYDQLDPDKQERLLDALEDQAL